MMTRKKRQSILSYTLFTAGLSVLSVIYTPLSALYAWFIVINLITFLSFGWDKVCARKQWPRTPESTFHFLGFVGAFPAIFLGRKVFRHKTIKQEFIRPMWLLFAVQLGIAIYISVQYF